MMSHRSAILPAVLAAVVVTAVGCIASKETPPPTPTQSPTETLVPTDTPLPTETNTPRPTPPPSLTPEPPCLSPDQVTTDDVGKVVEICGVIVGEGEIECEACAYGYYSYLTFKGGFTIISYAWDFSSYEGACVMAADTVEFLGGHPIFVYGSAEGYAGSSCVRDSNGTLTCASGDYFRFFESCD